MQIRNLFAGNGNRRKSEANWDALTRKLSTTQRELAAANQQIAELTEQRDQGRRNDIRHHNLWQSADREVKRLGFLLGADAQLPATKVPAPVDNGCRDTPLAAAETARDMTLTQIALPGEEQMAAELDQIRTAVRAKAEADTQQIRLPQIPDRPPVTDPVEAALNTPAPHPMASATSVPVTAALNAVTKVHATVTAN